MKVRKLTPAVLKKIIAEEKRKVDTAKKRNVSKKSSKKKMTLSEAVDESTKLALQEAKIIKALKKIRNRRKTIREKVKKYSK
jgi:hypothetical protein